MYPETRSASDEGSIGSLWQAASGAASSSSDKVREREIRMAEGLRGEGLNDAAPASAIAVTPCPAPGRRPQVRVFTKPDVIGVMAAAARRCSKADGAVTG